jgi:hypothetical protein
MEFGDSREAVWLMEVLETCVQELSEEQWNVDMHQLVQKCLDEPRNAQIAMQYLAQDLKIKLGGRSVENTPKQAISYRLLLGWIYLAYATSRDIAEGRSEPSEGIPQELEQIVRWNPEIIHCANYVSSEMERQR